MWTINIYFPLFVFFLSCMCFSSFLSINCVITRHDKTDQRALYLYLPLSDSLFVWKKKTPKNRWILNWTKRCDKSDRSARSNIYWPIGTLSEFQSQVYINCSDGPICVIPFQIPNGKRKPNTLTALCICERH